MVMGLISPDGLQLQVDQSESSEPLQSAAGCRSVSTSPLPLAHSRYWLYTTLTLTRAFF